MRHGIDNDVIHMTNTYDDHVAEQSRSHLVTQAHDSVVLVTTQPPGNARVCEKLFWVLVRVQVEHRGNLLQAGKLVTRTAVRSLGGEVVGHGADVAFVPDGTELRVVLACGTEFVAGAGVGVWVVTGSSDV